ncbi:MAG: GNAT family N-acetyltransferase, partial [Methylocystis sp.]|nr:GNAT family N-acetyltransferase [Methylocystis sp.]
MRAIPAAVAESELIEIVRTQDRLDEIGASWRDVRDRAKASIFQSHAWISAWAGALGERQRPELCIVVARSGGSIQAIAPFAIYKTGGLRVLDWAAREYSDYCDVILPPGVDRSLLDRMWVALEAERRFDLALLTHVRPDACVRALSNGVGSAGPRLELCHREETSSQLVSSASGGDAWFDAQPKKFRQNYRRGRKIVEEGARLTFRLLASDEPLEPALERLVELKRLWLARNGLNAPLFAPGSAMLQALVGAMLREGALRAFVIERDAKIIAISINCEDRGALLAYLTAYDPEFGRGSPGMMLMVDYIKWALDHGLKTVDFLTG